MAGQDGVPACVGAEGEADVAVAAVAEHLVLQEMSHRSEGVFMFVGLRSQAGWLALTAVNVTAHLGHDFNCKSCGFWHR